MEVIYRLDGAIVPKARPRVTAKRTFMPKNYADWKENAIAAFRLQHIGSAIAVPVSLEVVLIGKHLRKGDGDNTIGSICDALVQAGVLEDDNLLKVPSESLTLFHSKKDAIALIRLTDAIGFELPEWAKLYTL